MNKHLNTICLLLIWTFATTQQSYVDSLEKILPTITDPKEKTNILNELSFSIYAINPDKGFEYANSALDLSKSIEYDTGIIQSYYYMSVNEWARSNLESSINYAKKQIDQAKTAGLHESAGSGYNILCLIEQKLGNYGEALNYAFEFKEMSEEKNDTLQLSLALANIGTIYWELEDSLNAIKYYQYALDNMKSESSDPANIGALTSNLAAAQSPGPEKLRMLKEALSFNEANGFHHYIGSNHYYLGEFYHEYKMDLDSAMYFYRNSLKSSTQVGDAYQLANTSINLGQCFLIKENLDSANYYLQQGLELSEQAQLRPEKVKGLKSLAELFHLQKKPRQAYLRLKEGFDLRDEVYKDDLNKQISVANAQYETEKKEAEIAQQELLIQKQKSLQNLLVGGAIAGFALLGAVFFGLHQRNERKRKETQLALQLEQQRAKDLEDLSRSKTEFFNNVSHELRTPLTLVISPLEDAIHKVKHIGLKSDLNLALQNSKRLLSLTNEILDLSKIDAAKLDLEVSKIKLNSFLRRIYHSFDSLVKSRHIALIDNISKDNSILIETDVGKLEKIISNLVSNAIKYSNDQSIVELSLDYPLLDQFKLSFSVIDTGKGIPLEEQAYVFDRFYQSSTTAQASGTGIGLTLAKELTELLGGTLHLTSALDKGSQFNVQIPVKIEKQKGQTQTEQPIATDKIIFKPIFINGNKPSVLIVEDDIEMSAYLVSLLKKEYNCQTVFNGVQALELLQNQDFDLISSDIMMPEMDGFEFREELNKHKKWRTTPFIMLTARALEEDKLKGFQLGIDDYITKPFVSAELKARIYNLLKNKISRDQLQETKEEPPSFEEDFVLKAENLVLHHLDDSQFGVEKLAGTLNYSRRQLGRILQRTTGLSPVAFILEIRLQKAYQLIRDRKYSTINEVRYDVGIDSPSYFTTKFKERFGLSPSEL